MTGAGSRRMGCPEQKGVSVMQQVVCKFSKSGNMVIDPCIEAGAAANACLLAVKHRKFTEFESTTDCFWKMRPSLLKPFAFQGPNEDSNIVLSEEVENARCI